MKYLSLVIVVLVLFSCQSTMNQQKSNDLAVLKASEINSFAEIRDSITRTILQRLQASLEEKIYIKEYYPPLPGDTVQYLRSETTIERKKNEVVETEIQETGITEEKNTFQSIDSTLLTSKTNEYTEKKIDARPVQGKDWLWLSLGTGIVIVIIILYLKRKIPP
jgi:hypothetical protein